VHGFWILLVLTRSIEKSISIVKMRKERRGCGCGTFVGSRPVVARREAQRVHLLHAAEELEVPGDVSRRNDGYSCQGNTHRKGMMRAPEV
jgi:hypothetical protein